MRHEAHDIEVIHECEVLVIGSGVSGYCAAIQAGRCGARTMLLEKDEVLGGNSGPNLGVGITGADRYNHYAGETGIIQELQEDGCWTDAVTHVSGGMMGYSIHRRFEAVVQEHLERAGVQVLKRHYARRPIVEGTRIVGVIAEDLAAFRTVRIDVLGPVIEASGDGEIGALAGAHFDWGTEQQSEYKERSAADARTDRVQGTSLVAIAHRTDREIRFIPPAGTPEFIPRVWHGALASFLHHHGGWFSDRKDLFFLYVTETGGHLDTIREDGLIYERLLKQLWAEWDHIKNGPHREEAKCWDLLWVSPKAGKRESRRFVGDYVLTQTDLESGRTFEDDVAYGGHDLDDHRPLGEGSDIFAHSIPPLYGIPYRACYSRNLDNLFLAGRLISATHLAHSSTRIMRTGAAIGQAVGLAAALCLKHGCSPRELGQRYLPELQQTLLSEDATILGKAREDPGDLARSARVSATSEVRFNEQAVGPLVPLIAPAGVLLWDWPARLDAVEMYLRNTSEADQELTLSILRAKREPRWTTTDDWHAWGWNDLRDEAFTLLHRASGTLRAGSEGWFQLDLGGVELGPKDAASDADRVLIHLDANPDVQWAMAERAGEIAEAVEHSHHSPRWKPLGATGTLRLFPAPRLGEAANVTNGFLRRFSRAPLNLWLSDPRDGLPQSLTLEWDEPQTVSRVGLTFDNLVKLTHD
ncbi:MAG: FAD-dependent oxidoreductase, partial [Armatimonadetes bacterium]|nr:FAD-dependent oxidoreductase [Armatimonadota bacterium]